MITSSAPIHHIHSTSTMWRHRGSRASNPTLGYQIFVALHCTPLLTMYTHYLTTRARMKRGPAHMNDNEPKTSRRPIRPACIESASNDRGRGRSRRRPHRRASKSNGLWGYGPTAKCCTPRGLLEILRLYFLFVTVSVAPA